MNASNRLRAAVAAMPMFFSVASASAIEPPKDLAAAERWVVDSANCRADFLAGLQDRAFLDRLAQLGFVFQSDWQEGDLPEGQFTTPRAVTIFGAAATHFVYWGDSGAEFYARIAAAPEALAKTAGAVAVPTRLKKDFDERTLAVRFTHAAGNGGRLAPALFVRRAENGADSESGCRLFDG
jgi:hypothetical protein